MDMNFKKLVLFIVCIGAISFLAYPYVVQQLEQNRQKKQLDAFSSTLAFQQKKALYWKEKGQEYLMEEKLDSAALSFEKVLSFFKHDEEVNLQLATIYYNKCLQKGQQCEEALTKLNTSIGLSPSRKELFKSRSLVYERLGMSVEAIKDSIKYEVLTKLSD